MNKIKFVWSVAICVVTIPCLAFEPPNMGWSSWNTFGINISEDLIRQQVDAEKISGGPLRFHSDGTFNIVQFTDIHAGKDLKRNEPAIETINMVLDEEKPDLVVYTGDIVTENNPLALWEYVTKPCRKRNIPFVVTFGNHDSMSFS